MGYGIMGLDEYPEADLLVELERRKRLRRRGMCDYCRRPIKIDGKRTEPCRFPGRHVLVSEGG